MLVTMFSQPLCLLNFLTLPYMLDVTLAICYHKLAKFKGTLALIPRQSMQLLSFALALC